MNICILSHYKTPKRMLLITAHPSQENLKDPLRLQYKLFHVNNHDVNCNKFNNNQIRSNTTRQSR